MVVFYLRINIIHHWFSLFKVPSFISWLVILRSKICQITNCWEIGYQNLLAIILGLSCGSILAENDADTYRKN